MTLKRTQFKRKTPMARTPKPAKGPRPKVCKTCRQKFEPRTPLAVACSVPCAIEHGQKVSAAQKAKQQRQERAADKVKREKLKTKSDYMREAQSAVNTYVRLRDAGLPCISCGVMYPVTRNDIWDAGHMRSAGSSPGTRLNTLNIHKQCVKCNRHLSSNAIMYRIKLIEKIGLDLVERIEQHSGVAKFSHEYLIRFKEVFRKRVRHLTKLRARIGNGKDESSC